MTTRPAVWTVRSAPLAAPTYPASMHPIEHLRWVARARGLDPSELVREAAVALGTLRGDHRDLVIACRRIVERHPEAGPLWWLGAELLMADDPGRAAWELADRVGDDRSPRVIAAALPDDATVLTIGWPAIGGAALMRRGDARSSPPTAVTRRPASCSDWSVPTSSASRCRARRWPGRPRPPTS